jgi:hypothetical protein
MRSNPLVSLTRLGTYLRNHALGLVAIFIALSGSAAAATVVIKHDSNGSAKAKASKKARRGPQGPAGPQGAAGAQGAQGLQGPQGPGEIVAAGTMASPGVVANGSCATVNKSVSGVLGTDTVVVNPPTSWFTLAVSLYSHALGSGGSIGYTICNLSGGSPDFGTANDVTFMVLRP